MNSLTFVLFLSGLGLALGQADYMVPINCYYCVGWADNDTDHCADKFVPDKFDFRMTDQMNDSADLYHEFLAVGKNTDVKIAKCETGICVKWTKYKDNKLQMIRTCSSKLKFELTMIDGVCRTERNGNGYLCMCGKSKCNSAPSRHVTLTFLITLTFLTLAFTSWRGGGNSLV